MAGVSVPPIEVPPGLAAQDHPDPTWASWLDELPSLVRDLLIDWELEVDGAPCHGVTALVLPVLDADRQPRALKVCWPHEDSDHEHLALQAWHGAGAVLLHRADPHRSALLLERLRSDVPLETIPDLESCTVVAQLYGRLHVRALPQLRPLAGFVDRWTSALAGLPVGAPVPRRLVEQAVGLGRSFVADDATIGTLIHTDLHGGNVMAGDREPWLVIDPKPLSGDAHYEVAPMLWNRFDEIVASGDVRFAVRRRFHTIVAVAGLDEDRARDWVVVRELHNILWTLEDAERRQRPLRSTDREWITRSIAIAKAVQD